MQGLGFIIDKENNEKILVLARQAKYVRYFKRRKSGKDGIHFDEEENYFNGEGKENFKRLKNGEVVGC